MLVADYRRAIQSNTYNCLTLVIAHTPTVTNTSVLSQHLLHSKAGVIF